MAVDSDFQDFIVDQLSAIPLVPRRMFGGGAVSSLME